jgi:hypothetical protein
MKTELNNRYKKGWGEIKLFEEMSDILKNTYNVSYVGKTHAHYVSFASKVIKQRIRREISDLWIIMYSKKRKIAKMIFLQAKFHKTKTYLPFKFTGEYFQYELLSWRPEIKNIGKRFKFPSNILSFTENDSIGTFGTFYFDNNNKIDFAFAVASLLKPNKIGTQKTQTPIFLDFPNINNNSCLIKIGRNYEIEIVATLNIDCFAQSLLKLRIGAEFQTNYQLRSTVGGILRNSPAKDDVVVTDFLNSFDANSNDSQQNALITNFMIINVDPKNEK